MELEKMFNLLHLAKRAGKLKFGYQETVRMISSGKAKLVLLANDVSSNTRKKLDKVIAKNDLTYVVDNSMQEISQKLNIKITGILCVVDENLANGIFRLMGNEWRKNGDTSS